MLCITSACDGASRAMKGLLTAFHRRPHLVHNRRPHIHTHTLARSLAHHIGFNVLWSQAMKPEQYKELNMYQRTNHFPGTWELGRKDKLCRNINRMRRRLQALSKSSSQCPAGMDKAFLRSEIIPRSFLLPGEYDEWRTDAQMYPDTFYISKPVCLSRGRGIHMVRNIADVSRTKPVLIQRYIKNPLLLSNRKKFDIRIYVFVTSMDPLKVYIYDEGVVRFATREYNSDAKSLKQKDVHLTNYSINVKKKGFVEPTADDEDCGGDGSKWTLSALRRHLHQHHRDRCDFGSIWRGIKDIVVRTMISVESSMNTLIQPNLQHRSVCFELFGFDIVLDDAYRPWLLEVNTSPALQTPTLLDKRIKYPLATNMLELAGILPYSRTEFRRTQAEERRARLLGIGQKGSLLHASSLQSTAPSASLPSLSSSSSSAKERPLTAGSKRRAGDIRSLDSVDFRKIQPEDLPEVIQESEAELRRCGRFERVYPPTATGPDDVAADFYDIFFDSSRYNNALLIKYEKYKRAKIRAATRRMGRTKVQEGHASLR